MIALVAMAWLSISLSAAAADDQLGWVEEQRAHWNVPGVVAIVARKNEPAQVLPAGLCNVEDGAACTADSRFQIGSLTKFFTALLAAKLADEYDVSLDSPVVRIWTDFRLSDDRWREVSLIDLMSHRSGLASVDWPYYWDTSQSRGDFLVRLPYVPMDTAFRSGWSYSNTNYVIVGEFLERLTGAAWQDLLVRELLQPLGMKSYAFGVSGDGTIGYDARTPGSPLPLPAVDETTEGPAGSLVLNGNDYSRFLQMLVEEGAAGDMQIVSSAVLRQVREIHAPRKYDRRFFEGPSGYALGLNAANYHGDAIFFHEGGRLGFVSHIAWIPNRGLAVAVLTNAQDGLFPQVLALGLLSRALGRETEEDMNAWFETREPISVKPASQPGDSPSRQLVAYSGTYSNPAWGSFDIVVEQDTLRIRYGQLDAVLDSSGGDGFSFSSAPGWERIQIMFDADYDGRISSLVLDDGVYQPRYRFTRTEQSQ